MTKDHAAFVLREHNMWRRGLEDAPKYPFKAVAEAIDTLGTTEVLQRYIEYVTGVEDEQPDPILIGQEIDELVNRNLT